MVLQSFNQIQGNILSFVTQLSHVGLEFVVKYKANELAVGGDCFDS